VVDPFPASPALLDRARRIRVLLMDVDGVWTDGRLWYFPGPDGDLVETKASTAVDGQGLRWWHAAGYVSGIISGRDAPGITHRAEMLGISHIYQGHLDKTDPYEQILAATGADEEEVCYIGDDLPDVPLLRRVGLGVAVADARDEVLAVAGHVTAARGGGGAVREIIELILRARGDWEAVRAKYGIDP
jgi:3-deoxy-D-manno-octulosonate 8-phosphate phosphatase (KDO 8-P phosphatase)